MGGLVAGHQMKGAACLTSPPHTRAQHATLASCGKVTGVFASCVQAQAQEDVKQLLPDYSQTRYDGQSVTQLVSAEAAQRRSVRTLTPQVGMGRVEMHTRLVGKCV